MVLLRAGLIHGFVKGRGSYMVLLRAGLIHGLDASDVTKCI